MDISVSTKGSKKKDWRVIKKKYAADQKIG